MIYKYLIFREFRKLCNLTQIHTEVIMNILKRGRHTRKLIFIKVKLSRYTPWRRLGGDEVLPLLILDLGTRQGWVISVTPQPRFTLGKEPLVQIAQESGWAPEPVWTQRLEEKSSASIGDRTPVVQSVVRHYTDWATPAPLILTTTKN
jgi:hypothetical protein